MSDQKAVDTKGDWKFTKEELEDAVEAKAGGFVRVNNLTENHQGVQYKAGLVTLLPEEKFARAAPSCATGRLYATKLEFVEEHYKRGVWLRVVRPAPGTQALMDQSGTKWCFDKLLLSDRRYSLGDARTYALFGLDPSKNEHRADQALQIGNLEALEECHRVGAFERWGEKKDLFQILWDVYTPANSMIWWMEHFCVDAEYCLDSRYSHVYDHVQRLASQGKLGVEKLVALCKSDKIGLKKLQPFLASCRVSSALLQSVINGVGYDLPTTTVRQRLLDLFQALPAGLEIIVGSTSSSDALQFHNDEKRGIEVLETLLISNRAFQLDLDAIAQHGQLEILQWCYEHRVELGVAPTNRALLLRARYDGEQHRLRRDDPVLSLFQSHLKDWSFVVESIVKSGYLQLVDDQPKKKVDKCPRDKCLRDKCAYGVPICRPNRRLQMTHLIGCGFFVGAATWVLSKLASSKQK